MTVELGKLDEDWKFGYMWGNLEEVKKRVKRIEGKNRDQEC